MAHGKPVTPLSAADAIIEIGDRIVLIERANEPRGLAIPGGFMDEGESAEQAAIREAREETGLDVELIDLLGVYSDPRRDPRCYVISCVYVARASGEPNGGDDASRAFLVDPENLPGPLVFDHARILHDYLRYKREGRGATPREMLDRLKRPLTQP